MKKYFVIALLAFIGITHAQVTFKPGMRAGANFSHFSKGNDEYVNDVNNTNRRSFSSKSDFYIGFYGALHLTKYYTLQPEIDYSRQGDFFKANDQPEIKLDVSYLSVNIINKFTFSDKFNAQIGTTIDFIVDNSVNFDPDSEVDLAFVLGAGYNFTSNLGIEARVKKGIIPVLDYSDGNHTNVVFSVGATYTFNLKK